jgi:anti-sigma factor RsiW
MKEIRVHRYLDGEMGKEEKQNFELHLKECSLCRTRLNEIKELDSIMHTTSDVEPPEYLVTRILANAREKEARKASFRGLKLIPYGVAIAASLYLGIFTAFWSTSTNPAEQSSLDSYENSFLYSSFVGE